MKLNSMLNNITARRPDELADFERLSLAEQVKTVIEEHNASRGDLTGYDCKKCLNRGNFYIEDGYGGFESVECECMYVRRAYQRLHLMGLDKAAKECRFDNFKQNHTFQKKMYSAAFNYADNPKGWLVLCGQSGCGKTHLAISAFVQLIVNQKLTARLMQWIQESAFLKSHINDDKYEDRISEYQAVGLLLIDDFFNTKPTDADVKLARSLLDYRYLKKMPTIITTELTLSEIYDIDDAVGGRIIEMALCCAQVGRDIKKNYRLEEAQM